MSRLRANQAAMLAEYSHSDSLQPDEPRPGRDGGRMNKQRRGPNYARRLDRLAKASDGVLIYSW